MNAIYKNSDYHQGD